MGVIIRNGNAYGGLNKDFNVISSLSEVESPQREHLYAVENKLYYHNGQNWIKFLSDGSSSDSRDIEANENQILIGDGENWAKGSFLTTESFQYDGDWLKYSGKTINKIGVNNEDKADGLTIFSGSSGENLSTPLIGLGQEAKIFFEDNTDIDISGSNEVFWHGKFKFHTDNVYPFTTLPTPSAVNNSDEDYGAIDLHGTPRIDINGSSWFEMHHMATFLIEDYSKLKMDSLAQACLTGSSIFKMQPALDLTSEFLTYEKLKSRYKMINDETSNYNIYNMRVGTGSCLPLFDRTSPACVMNGPFTFLTNSETTNAYFNDNQPYSSTVKDVLYSFRGKIVGYQEPGVYAPMLRLGPDSFEFYSRGGYGGQDFYSTNNSKDFDRPTFAGTIKDSGEADFEFKEPEKISWDKWIPTKTGANNQPEYTKRPIWGNSQFADSNVKIGPGVSLLIEGQKKEEENFKNYYLANKESLDREYGLLYEENGTQKHASFPFFNEYFNFVNNDASMIKIGHINLKLTPSYDALANLIVDPGVGSTLDLKMSPNGKNDYIKVNGTAEQLNDGGKVQYILEGADVFVQHEGFVHTELHDYSTIVMRGQSSVPWGDKDGIENGHLNRNWYSPIFNIDSPIFQMYNSANFIMRGKWEYPVYTYNIIFDVSQNYSTIEDLINNGAISDVSAFNDAIENRLHGCEYYAGGNITVADGKATISNFIYRLKNWNEHPEKASDSPLLELYEDAEVRIGSARIIADENGITINGISFTNEQLEALKQLLS